MEAIILILEVIILIIKQRINPGEATKTVAEKYGMAYSKLWEALPKRWK